MPKFEIHNVVKKNYMTLSIKALTAYFSTLLIAFHDLPSLFGLMILLTIVSQLVSGTMLAFSLVPEPMLIPMVRDEEDLEDLYSDDMF